PKPKLYIEPQTIPVKANKTVSITNDSLFNSISKNPTLPIDTSHVSNRPRPLQSPSEPIGSWNTIAPKLNISKIHVTGFISNPFLSENTGKFEFKVLS